MNSVATQLDISVVIPVYNCARKLRLCLDALKSLLMTLLFYVYSVAGASWGILSYLLQGRLRKAA